MEQNDKYEKLVNLVLEMKEVSLNPIEKPKGPDDKLIIGFNEGVAFAANFLLGKISLIENGKL